MHLEQFGSCISLMSSYFLISRLPVDFVGPATLILWLFGISLAQLLAFCGFVDPSKSFQGVVAPPNSLFSYFAASQQHSKSISCHFLAQRPRQDLIYTIQLLHGPLLVPFAAPPRTFSRDFKGSTVSKVYFLALRTLTFQFRSSKVQFLTFYGFAEPSKSFPGHFKALQPPKKFLLWVFHGSMALLWSIFSYLIV